MNKIKYLKIALLVLVVGFLTAGISIYASVYRPGTAGVARSHTLVNESESSATSSARSLVGVKGALFEFASDGPNGTGVGTTTFKVQVTLDGTTFHDYNRLISNVTDTNAEDDTRVGTVDITATSSELYIMDLSSENYYQTRCVTVEAGTTTASCKILIQH